jgi:hypothetical protein
MVMNKDVTSPKQASDGLTQHAMLVAWGLYARQLGLVEALDQVAIKQKVRTHRPQTKVLEFLVAILAGLPYLQDISRSAHPLDQDQMVADAWGQPAWADYSGVSRALQRLTASEVEAIVAVLDSVSQPFIDQETRLALERHGYLVYDADLTGRPVSSTSTTYPDVAFGYMGDGVALGYQAALVSIHSPTYGRLWLTNQLHSGDTVSCTQAQALVLAAEARTGLRPRRRTEWIAERLAAAEEVSAMAGEHYECSYEKLREVENKVHDATIELAMWQREVATLTAEYTQTGRQPTSHCKLTRAQGKVTMYEGRLPRLQRAQEKAQSHLLRDEKKLVEARAKVQRLHEHHQQLLADNVTMPNPIRAIFRLDSGFATKENIAWLIEMGYDIYTKARSAKISSLLAAADAPDRCWQRVGGNASLTAWSDTTADGHFIYPVNVALARYTIGNTIRHAFLVHYGDDNVMHDLPGWFHTYNGRQTIEAGIKEGKNVFQMHHLKVRSAQALLLQEHFACFAANFVRFAALWLADQQTDSPSVDMSSVKQMVQICAHTSAWIQRQGDVWLLTFAEQSLYAGRSLRIGFGAVQLPLPLCRTIQFCHF